MSAQQAAAANPLGLQASTLNILHGAGAGEALAAGRAVSRPPSALSLARLGVEQVEEQGTEQAVGGAAGDAAPGGDSGAWRGTESWRVARVVEPQGQRAAVKSFDDAEQQEGVV